MLRHKSIIIAHEPFINTIAILGLLAVKFCYA